VPQCRYNTDRLVHRELRPELVNVMVERVHQAERTKMVEVTDRNWGTAGATGNQERGHTVVSSGLYLFILNLSTLTQRRRKSTAEGLYVPRALSTLLGSRPSKIVHRREEPC
jgi:hypothetical protein